MSIDNPKIRILDKNIPAKGNKLMIPDVSDLASIKIPLNLHTKKANPLASKVSKTKAKPKAKPKTNPSSEAKANPSSEAKANPSSGAKANPIRGAKANPIRGAKANPIRGAKTNSSRGAKANPSCGAKANPSRVAKANPSSRTKTSGTTANKNKTSGVKTSRAKANPTQTRKNIVSAEEKPSSVTKKSVAKPKGTNLLNPPDETIDKDDFEKNFQYPAQEILPGLWLGDINAANDKKFLRSKNITAIINCTKTLPFVEDKNITTKYRVAVRDNLEDVEIYKLYKLLNPTVNKIYTLLQDQNVLVHCHKGKQRSATVIAAFLMKFAGMSKNEALASLKSKRPLVVSPGINFDEALTQYEKDLKL